MNHRSNAPLGFLLLLLLVILPACASTGGSAVYRMEVGGGTESNAREVVERVMAFNQYELDRVEESPNFRMESRWRLRPPLADERALGITEAESRVILVGRLRAPSELGEQFAFTIIVENRTRAGAGEPWVPTRNTDMFVQYARGIAEQVEQEFRTIGVRRF
jgi:hypothetical protein